MQAYKKIQQREHRLRSRFHRLMSENMASLKIDAREIRQLYNIQHKSKQSGIN